jgi:2-polyprenyl-6-methoxyphenol hydroxylase-like FAD-dependent oxidoreductase
VAAPFETDVLIAGGGPVGLALALELEHRGVRALLVERNPSTTRHPKMDVTNGRSMEHFRRLGVADAMRARAVPGDHPMSVVWCSRPAEWELARFDYPGVDEVRARIRATNDGTLPLEPNMRISQVVLEPVLKEQLERHARHVRVEFGQGLEGFEQDEHGVTAVVRDGATGATRTVRARYLAGCDGASSVTRRGLGIASDEMRPEAALSGGDKLRALAGAARGLLRGERPPDGRIYLIHFRSRDRAFFERFGTLWHLQSPHHGTLIAQNDVDTWTLHVPLAGGVDAERIDPKTFLFENLGRAVDCEILVANPWQPRLVLAESYGRGRVWLAGDSAHQYIPTGGYGMNTGVGDAVDLGWKLAAVLQGWGGPRLLPSYDAERRPVGFRNRAASARHLAIRVAIASAYTSRIHEDSARGAEARRSLGAKIRALGNLENEALGIEIGYRYDDSPVLCRESGEAPPRTMERYHPSTWPGVRVPSVFLADGRALFDLFGRGFTLLRFADVATTGLERAAAERGVPLVVLDVRDEHTARLYERRLVLVRPDQHAAWRGDAGPDDPLAVIDHVRGAGR